MPLALREIQGLAIRATALKIRLHRTRPALRSVPESRLGEIAELVVKAG